MYQRLKNLRNDKDLTQQELADYLKISRSAYQNYESGTGGIPIKILSKSADFYCISVDYLIGRTNCKEPYLKK
ncbi:helix-turn-helix domain-containing protein [Anaeropeptidivorans aminofermentans]|uniref:helix-turn-helix domain-containing protein n=1 Tax=Anaeropeptidivorans aminofermentans TaxID=2934315 RepID=UPI002024416B|nr:helix-turn-helix transcriptional regulator [Anaeropeptidivorans aminofermentans]